MSIFLNSLRAFVVLVFLTGVIYPGFSLILARVFFVESSQMGIKRIGQKFESARYFWGRPSATGYNSLPSGASNLGPTSLELKTNIEQRIHIIHQAHPTKAADKIPIELLTASASGLDPDISLEAVIFQVDRVALERKLDKEQIWKLNQIISDLTQTPTFGILGTTRLNVLELNLALDQLGAK